MAPSREIVAENIAALRKSAKLTQAELAEKLTTEHITRAKENMIARFAYHG